MATRDLSQTVTEGGRREYNKFERRKFTRQERHETKALLREIRNNPLLLENSIAPLRQKEPIDQADKLGPMWRWLDSQVGKEWNKIYSAIRHEFDTRTTPGRHIVFDHLLSTILFPDMSESERFFKTHTIKPADGTLTRIPPKRFSWERDLTSYGPEVFEWLQDRYIGKRGKFLFWFIPFRKIEWRFFPFAVGETGDKVLFGSRITYRQDRKLTTGEENYFYSLTKTAQHQIFYRGSKHIPNLIQ